MSSPCLLNLSNFITLISHLLMFNVLTLLFAIFSWISLQKMMLWWWLKFIYSEHRIIPRYTSWRIFSIWFPYLDELKTIWTSWNGFLSWCLIIQRPYFSTTRLRTALLGFLHGPLYLSQAIRFMNTFAGILARLNSDGLFGSYNILFQLHIVIKLKLICSYIYNTVIFEGKINYRLFWKAVFINKFFEAP